MENNPFPARTIQNCARILRDHLQGLFQTAAATIHKPYTMHCADKNS